MATVGPALSCRWSSSLSVRRRTTPCSGSPLLCSVTWPPTASKVPASNRLPPSANCTHWSSPTCSRRSWSSSRPAVTPSSTDWPNHPSPRLSSTRTCRCSRFTCFRHHLRTAQRQFPYVAIIRPPDVVGTPSW